MKKTILAFLFSLFFLNANSQDILDNVVKEVCSCATAKADQLKGLPADKLQLELGFCIITSYSNHEKELTAKYGNVMEGDGMEKLGTDIGLKMASACPDVFRLIAGSSFEDEETQAISTVEGQIVAVKSEQFLTIEVKDNSGRTHAMLLLTFFEGSDILTENKLKKNDKVSIDYWEQEFYDVKAKDFRNYKVIQSIKKI